MLHKDSIAKDFNTTTNKNIMNPASNKRSQIKYADLQRQFIFLPFTTFLNCLVVMFTEVVTSNTAVFQEVLFIKFSLDYSYAFYFTALIFLIISPLIMVVPYLVYKFLIKGLASDNEAICSKYRTGVKIMGWLIIIRGASSTAGIYIGTAYVLGEPIYVLVFMWTAFVIRNFFIIRKNTKRLLSETGNKLKGIKAPSEEIASKLPSILSFDSSEYDLIIGIEPKIEIVQADVYLSYTNETASKAIYIGLPLLHLISIEEIAKYINKIKNSRSEQEDWVVGKQKLLDKISEEYGRRSLLKVIYPIIAFSELFSDQLENENIQQNNTKEIKINELYNYWERDVLPNLEGELQLGRKPKNMGLKLLNVLEVASDLGRELKELKSQLSEKAIAKELAYIDEKLSRLHIEWMISEGRLERD